MIAPRLPALLLLLLLSVAGTAQASCNEQILAATCADSPASGSCAICVGHHQRELRLAGCSAADVQRYCSEGVAVWVSSTSGSDTAGDGRSPTTALRTLAAALPAVRRLKLPNVVLLLDGTFRLTETLTLNSPFAGLRIDRWPGRQAPVLSGSAQLASAGWVRSSNEPGVWRATLAPAQAAALDGKEHGLRCQFQLLL
jgi:hypothetical protein